MTTKEELMQQASWLWDRFVVEVQALGADLHYWLSNLNDEERMIGICLFIVVLIYMIFSRRVATNTDTGNGRQFTGALVLVIIFAFGIGWSMDLRAGSLSHLFQL